MIQLKDLTKSYLLNNGERRYIFRALDFNFPDKVNIGLIGRNGAGKSTLLSLIGGIDVPDSGRVISDQRISWPVGLSGGFHGLLTGRDSIKFVCRIYGAEGQAMREKIRFVEEFAELGDYFDQPINAYSSGMRSRLGFGMSMAFEFDYYLIDEAMAVGDAQFRMKSRALLQERLGQSHVIMVSHNMEDISRLCDVVVLVQDGQAMLFENVREGIRAYQESSGKPVRPKKKLGPNRARQAGAGAGMPRKLPGLGTNGENGPRRRIAALAGKGGGSGRGLEPGARSTQASPTGNSEMHANQYGARKPSHDRDIE